MYLLFTFQDKHYLIFDIRFEKKICGDYTREVLKWKEALNTVYKSISFKQQPRIYNLSQKFAHKNNILAHILPDILLRLTFSGSLENVSRCLEKA